MRRGLLDKVLQVLALAVLAVMVYSIFVAIIIPAMRVLVWLLG